MYKPVKYITKIPYRDFSTYYLFYKNDRTLIPVEIQNKSNGSAPSVYDTIVRILRAAGFSMTGIKIYRFFDNTFYTYLTIKRHDSEFDININFKDGIEISNETSTPIFVKDQVLKTCGIEITKDMVLKAIKETQ